MEKLLLQPFCGKNPVEINLRCLYYKFAWGPKRRVVWIFRHSLKAIKYGGSPSVALITMLLIWTILPKEISQKCCTLIPFGSVAGSKSLRVLNELLFIACSVWWNLSIKPLLVLLSPPVECAITPMFLRALQNSVDLQSSPPSSILKVIGVKPIFLRQVMKNIIMETRGRFSQQGKANGYLQS